MFSTELDNYSCTVSSYRHVCDCREKRWQQQRQDDVHRLLMKAK